MNHRLTLAGTDCTEKGKSNPAYIKGKLIDGILILSDCTGWWRVPIGIPIKSGMTNGGGQLRPVFNVPRQ